jgi:hypothetical protein
VTLVIAGEGDGVPVLWAELNVESLAEAKHELEVREGTTPLNIGAVEIGNGGIANGAIAERISTWGASQELDAVVWTALGPSFKVRGEVPSAETVLDYLKGLDGTSRFLAERYVRQTPRQIVTPYRESIEADEELGWKYDSVSEQFIVM